MRVIQTKTFKTLLEIDPNSIIFINIMLIRFYEKERKRVWLIPDEYEYPDVIQPTDSNKEYNYGQFFGTICYERISGPYATFPIKIEIKKDYAQKHISELNR